MKLQEKINESLETAIKERLEITDDLKFIKAELQRGKYKELSDDETVKILVGILRNQERTKDYVLERGDHNNIPYIDKTILCVKHFIPNDILDQVYMVDIQVIDWIENNVDMSKVKNNNQVIGIVKKAFPYVDGELVKVALKMMEEGKE